MLKSLRFVINKKLHGTKISIFRNYLRLYIKKTVKLLKKKQCQIIYLIKKLRKIKSCSIRFACSTAACQAADMIGYIQKV